MKVKDVMTDQVVYCGPDTNVAAAAALMWSADCGALPVVTGGKLAGVITDRDICIALGTRNQSPSELAVKEVATQNVQTCLPDADVHTAMDVMRRAKVRRVPVVDGQGRLQGIVSLNDLVLAAGRKHGTATFDEVVDTMKAVCEHRSHKPPARATGAAVTAVA